MELYAHVINLRRRADRKKRMLEIMPRCLTAEFTSDWTLQADWREI